MMFDLNLVDLVIVDVKHVHQLPNVYNVLILTYHQSMVSVKEFAHLAPI
jgi:hypothetical protein